MSASDSRHLDRDSLFLMADLRVDGIEDEFRIKVRNLSSGGMMGEGQARVVRGVLVEVNLRNYGWVEGSVAWVEADRFGIAFRDEIDPKAARAPVGMANQDDAHTPRYLRSSSLQAEPSNLRKI